MKHIETSEKYQLNFVILKNLKGGLNMERKTLGILALALVGLFAVSMVVAMPFGNKDAARDAVEAGDYDAWKVAVTADLSEENFDRMTQMHELREQMHEVREAGDWDAMELLMDEFREFVPEGHMGMGGGHMGSGRGFGGMGSGRGQMHEGCPFAE